METMLLVTLLVIGFVLIVTIIRSDRARAKETAGLHAEVLRQRCRLDDLADTTERSLTKLDRAVSTVAPLPPDLSAYFEPGQLDAIESGDVLICTTNSPAEVLVFGGDAEAERLGTIVHRLPSSFSKIAVGTDALVRAGIEIGQQTGKLVRLTPESTKMLRELRQIKDASGAMMGVLKAESGKFKHVVRFRPAGMLQTASGVTGALGAMAMQAQLASLERAIKQVSSKVDAVHTALDRSREADARATRAVIFEVYRAAQQTGTLTHAMWQQIAPLSQPVRRLQEHAKLEAEGLLKELEGLQSKPIADRRERLMELNNKGVLERIFDVLQRENRTLVQFQALRLWHLIEVSDGGLSAYQDELREEVLEQQDLLDSLQRKLVSAIDMTDVRGRLEKWVNPFDARAVERCVNTIRDRLEMIRQAIKSALEVQAALAPVGEPADLRASETPCGTEQRDLVALEPKGGSPASQAGSTTENNM